VTGLVAVLWVLPGVAAALPASIQHPVEKFWPTQAGGQVTEVIRQANTLPALAGFGVMFLFVAIALSAAFFTVDRRDA
jgi:hypothetical protein